MANPTIKPTAIVRAGYEFQDLVGIETLIRFYRSPELFEWVALEADNDEYGSLDDVVAARTDGSFEFVQVKFTVGGEANLLDWDWLLARKARGTSLLSKWATSLRRVGALGPITSACLRTNRAPSAAFSAAMTNHKISLGAVDADLRKAIETECGGAEAANSFFSQFEFQTIPDTLPGLEARIRLELVPSDLLPAGWHYFRDMVRRWAMLRNEPPGGRILFRHLAQVITRERPEPIRQDFQIPPGYSLPNQKFHEDFRLRIAAPETPVTVLWGTPGRGKSTYLSFLSEELRQENKAILRHHYFLSGDDTADRISYSEISHSLVSQLELHHPDALSSTADDTDKLRSTLTSAARYFKEAGERLYIVVDGLDHVWRDYRKVDQLNFLFNQLLPLPENVSLIVGTQRVPNEQLPNKLLAQAREDDWLAIPPMAEVAVYSWIVAQDSASRLILLDESEGEERASGVAAISSAFYKVSGGHPLHLIYAFETLVRTGAPIREEDVALIPPCPDGDIRAYYGGLWNTLTDTGKQVLHALAGSEFYWPSLGIRQCLGTYAEIAFLLEPRASGMHPFHGSILAYVRERDDHEEAFRVILPRVVNWLENDAPPYWRWGWLWLSKAKLGDFQPLLDGVSREWAVSSLATGWSERQIVRVLQVAEEYAFDILDLPRAVGLRSIKTRVLNAREYQVQDFAAFEEAAIKSHKNWQQLDNLLDNAAGLTDGEVAMLARAAPKDRRPEVSEQCAEELGRRIDVWMELRHRPEGEFISLAHLFCDVIALCGVPDVDGVWDFLLLFGEPSSHIRYFAERLAKALQYEALIQLWEKASDPKWHRERLTICDDILRVACHIGADPSKRISLDEASLSPLYGVWSHLHRPGRAVSVALPAVPANMLRDRYDYGIDHGIRNFVYALFFGELGYALKPTSDRPFSYPGLVEVGLGWLGGAFKVVRETARRIARRELQADFSAIYVGTAGLPAVFHGRNGASENDQALYKSVLAGLRMIAPDLHLVGASAASGTLIDEEAIRRAQSSPHWNDEAWLLASDCGHPVMSGEGARLLIDTASASLSASISEFPERAEAWALRSRVASLYDLPDSKALAERAGDCLLGYGYRKDPWVFDILDAVGTAHDPELSPALDWIRSLVPVVDKITEYTDGAGTNHAPTRLIEAIAETYPERLGEMFSHYVEEEEWRQADDCLVQFAKVWPLASPDASALAGTFIDSKTLGSLRDRSERGDAIAADLLDRQLRFLGGMPADHSDHYHSTTETEEKEPPEKRDRAFDDFAGVISDIGGLGAHRDIKAHYSGWLGRHAAAGKGKQALDAIRHYFASGEPRYHAEEALDAAFDVSMAVEGREAAYEWLVKAHIARYGWQSNWTSRDEVLGRLRLVADHYSERWAQFVKDTSEPQEFWKKRGYGLTIGSKYLVHFLLMVNQRDLARRVVDVMVASIIEEVHDQPIPEAPWFR